MSNNKNKQQTGRPDDLEVAQACAADPHRSVIFSLGGLVAGYNPAGPVVADRRNCVDRRETAFRAFMYGNFHPRRRQSRRSCDDHLYLFDWYEPRVLYLALGVLLLSCTDALFTLNLLPLGAGEANVLMASLLGHGMTGFLAGKISLTAISLILLVSVVRRKFYRSLGVEHLLKLFFAAYLMVILYEIYLFKFVFNLNFI